MDRTLVTVLLLLGAAAVALYNVEGGSAKLDSFEQFKADFGKRYGREGEEEYRRSIFMRNLVKYAAHNANPKNTHSVGVNQFSDLLDAEFAAIYLTLQVPKIQVVDEKIFKPTSSLKEGEIDWAAQGGVTQIKNQGACGSCWAFAATAALESAYLISQKEHYDLSEQELVDCSRYLGNQGCDGGWMEAAFAYIIPNDINFGSDYPYTAQDQLCKRNLNKERIGMSGYYNIFSSCTDLANALSLRPVSVAVDASVWGAYKAGILSNCGLDVNHGVLLVGATDEYWKIKNSWGTSWGESGYMRLTRGNTCAICSYPTVPIL